MVKFGPQAKTAVPALIAILEGPTVHNPSRGIDSRSAAAEALIAIGPDATAAVPALERALADSDLRPPLQHPTVTRVA
jgi:HEAT repeat protein